MEPQHAETHAAQIEQALAILHQGDARVSQADRFLSQIRASPAIWQILAVLIHSPNTSHAAIMFASRTLYLRLRADWLAFNDDARASAYSLAVDGACRSGSCTARGSPPVYFFGRACGFGISMGHVDVREAMWALMNTKLSDRPVLKCQVLAAVVNEVDVTSTRDVAKHVETRAFCRDKAREVVPLAISLLLEFDPATSSDVGVQDMRAVVSCLHAWRLHGDKVKMGEALLRVIVVPQLADDVAETLNEIVGFSGTSLHLLSHTCEGLGRAFQTVSGSRDAGLAQVVHHAIAEVACAISDGNADELMEQESAESKVVVSNAIELLWMCLKSQDDRCFFAAVEGMSNWIAAQNLVGESQRKISSDQIITTVGVVVMRMRSLRFVELDLTSGVDDISEHANESGCVSDLLLACASSVGINEYVTVIMSLFANQPPSSVNAICACLRALAVGGEICDADSVEKDVRNVVTRMQEHIMELFESRITMTSVSSGSEKAADRALKASILRTLAAYAHALTASGSDTTFYRSVRCAGNGMLDEMVCEEAAFLLCELAEYRSCSLIQYLPELISSSTGAFDRVTPKATELSVRGLSRVASAIPSHAERLAALVRILETSCERLRWICSKRPSGQNDASICKDLTLVSVAIHEVNDNEAATRIFEQLRPTIFDIATRHSSNSGIARGICRLLEVCVLPTLMDDDGGRDAKDDRKGRRTDEGARLLLASACTGLAGECFRKSGPDGETCWLKAMAELSLHMLRCVEGASPQAEAMAMQSVSTCVGHASSGLIEFSDGDYDTQPDMAIAYFRLAAGLVWRTGNALLPHARGMSEIGMRALTCTSINIVRESLAFWKVVFSSKTPRETTLGFLSAAGGPQTVTAGVLCAAQMSKCAAGVTDTLFAMCRVVGGEGEGEAVLQRCLRAAFEVEHVPRQGLDKGVREMLFRGCFGSAGSKRDFRRAVDEVGRVCATAIR